MISKISLKFFFLLLIIWLSFSCFITITINQFHHIFCTLFSNMYFLLCFVFERLNCINWFRLFFTILHSAFYQRFSIVCVVTGEQLQQQQIKTRREKQKQFERHEMSFCCVYGAARWHGYKKVIPSLKIVYFFYENVNMLNCLEIRRNKHNYRYIQIREAKL